MILVRSPVGQLLIERNLALKETRHSRDGPHIPPSDVTILGSGDGRLRHPLVHGSLDVIVSDSGQACGSNGGHRLKRS